jgi:hypothetical protein
VCGSARAVIYGVGAGGVKGSAVGAGVCHNCRPCESRDPYAVPYREDTAYGSRLFGRDDEEIWVRNAVRIKNILRREWVPAPAFARACFRGDDRGRGDGFRTSGAWL